MVKLTVANIGWWTIATEKFGELTPRAFGERKFGKLIDQPID